MMQNGTDLGAILRDQRTRQGLTQAGLAAKAGLGLHAVWELEHNDNGSVQTLIRVTDTLGLRFTGLPRGSDLIGRVKAARARAGQSLETLAARSGVSKGAVIRLEQGSARVATLQKVLRVTAPKFGLRAPEVARWVGSGDRDIRFTPPHFLEPLTRALGPIALDPCGHELSPVQARRRFTEEDDGLAQPWVAKGLVFVNPPFSKTKLFVEKALHEWRSGRAPLVAILARASTDGSTFHDVYVPYAHTILMRKRLNFLGPDARPLGAAGSMFPTLVAVFGATVDMADQLRTEFDGFHIPPQGTADRPELPGFQSL